MGARVPEGDGSLLDGEVLKKSVSGLSNITYEVVESSDDGERATVRASYTLDGAQKHTDFRLHHVGDHWGLFPRWERLWAVRFAVPNGTMPIWAPVPARPAATKRTLY